MFKETHFTPEEGRLFFLELVLLNNQSIAFYESWRELIKLGYTYFLLQATIDINYHIFKRNDNSMENRWLVEYPSDTMFRSTLNRPKL